MRLALGLPWKATRTNKEYLKFVYSGILPNEILNHQKVPLRNPEYQKNKKEWSEKVIKAFLEVENLFE
jgi:asparagine synthetase B (glutamine-hydrolysing)